MCVQKSLFQEVSRGEPLLGVNPHMPAQSHGYQNLEAERLALGEKGALSYFTAINFFNIVIKFQ